MQLMLHPSERLCRKFQFNNYLWFFLLRVIENCNSALLEKNRTTSTFMQPQRAAMFLFGPTATALETLLFPLFTLREINELKHVDLSDHKAAAAAPLMQTHWVHFKQRKDSLSVINCFFLSQKEPQLPLEKF